MENKSAWEKYKAKELKAVFSLSEDYRKFISDCKTERECVSESIKLAKEAGFKDLADIIKAGKKLKAGDKVYANNMDKNLMLFVIGIPSPVLPYLFVEDESSWLNGSNKSGR